MFKFRRLILCLLFLITLATASHAAVTWDSATAHLTIHKDKWVLGVTTSNIDYRFPHSNLYAMLDIICGCGHNWTTHAATYVAESTGHQLKHYGPNVLTLPSTQMYLSIGNYQISPNFSHFGGLTPTRWDVLSGTPGGTVNTPAYPRLNVRCTRCNTWTWVRGPTRDMSYQAEGTYTQVGTSSGYKYEDRIEIATLELKNCQTTGENLYLMNKEVLIDGGTYSGSPALEYSSYFEIKKGGSYV